MKIYLCFTETDSFDSLEEFIDALVKKSKEDTSIEEEEKWGGFFGGSYLSEALKNKFSGNGYQSYSIPKNETLGEIKVTIEDAIKSCQRILPSEQGPIRIFVYPWFPGEDEQVFNGVMGTTFFGNTFHLYIDTKNFSAEALKNTIAHEFNHAIYFNYHHPFKQTILEAMVLEGLAEHFREDVVGGQSAPWSNALNENEARGQFERMEKLGYITIGLEENPEEYWNFYGKVFYGKGEDYKRWTGYSIGYQIIKTVVNNGSDISWKNLMKMEPEEILEISDF